LYRNGSTAFGVMHGAQTRRHKNHRLQESLRVWVRVSAQVYNEIGDYQRLAALGETLLG